MKKKILSVILAVSVIVSTFVSLNLGSVSALSNDIGQYAWENFENMTDNQAENYFSGSKGDTDAFSTSVEANSGENSSKALKLSLTLRSWVNISSAPIQVPNNAVGIRVWYKLSKDTSMRFQLKDYTEGVWTNIAFEGSKESQGNAKAGEHQKTVMFSDTDYNSDHQYILGFEASGGSDVEFYIDNITFITVESYEDFENMTDDQAASYFSGDKDATVTQTITNNGENGSSALSVNMNFPYKWCWLNFSSSKLSIDNSVIGINMWYSVSADTSMRLQLKDQSLGSWTNIAFEGSKESQGSVSQGTYKKTIYFADTEYDDTHAYALGLEAKTISTEASAVELIIDNIEYIRYGTSEAGDSTDLKTQINEVKAVAEGNSDLYRQESWNTFMAAYNNAVALAADATSTQRQLDQAKATLKSAYEALEPVSVIKTQLEAKLSEVKSILDDSDVETKYTAKSIESLTKAYNTAKAVYEDSDAAQSEINKQTTALQNAVTALKKIPTEAELVYKTANDKLIMDFEHFEDSIDMSTLDYSTSHPFQMDSGLTNTLETKNPISGDKSWKIGWKTLGSEFWGAERMYMFNGYLENQAMYMDIVCPNDWNGSFSLYDESASVVYDYNVDIKGSMEVQHLVIPFNQFKHDGAAMANTEWESFRQGAIIFKININKVLGGLPDNSFMIIDNMTLVTLNGLKAPYEYNYTTLPSDGNTGDDGDKGDSGNQGDNDDDNNVDIDGDFGSGYTEIEKFETPTKDFNLTADKLSGLVGSGMYFNVKSATDDILKITVTDGTVYQKYEIAVDGSTSSQLINVDYSNIVSAFRTFGELNRANISVSAAFQNDGKMNSFGSYNYAEIYATNFGTGDNVNNGANGGTDGGTNGSNTGTTNGSGNSNSPQTGDTTRAVLFAMLGIISLGIVLTVRKVIITNK